MPPIRQRQPYGYIYHPNRVEVYRQNGKYLGEVRRMRRDMTTIRYRYWVGDIAYARLQDAARALETL